MDEHSGTLSQPPRDVPVLLPSVLSRAKERDRALSRDIGGGVAGSGA